MEHNNWQCPKCQNKEFEADQFAGEGLTKFFNIQNKRFTTVTCTSCNLDVEKLQNSLLGEFRDVKILTWVSRIAIFRGELSEN